MKKVIFGLITSLILVSCVPQADYDALQDKYNSLKESSTKTEEEKEALQAELATANDLLSSLQADKTSLEAQVCSLNSDITVKTRQIDALQSDIATLQSRVASLEALLDEDTQLETIEALQTQIAQLNSQISEKQTELDAKQDEIEALHSQLQAKEASIQALNLVITDKEDSISQLEKSIFVTTYYLSHKQYTDMAWNSGHYYGQNDLSSNTLDFIDEETALYRNSHGTSEVVDIANITHMTSTVMPFDFIKVKVIALNGSSVLLFRDGLPWSHQTGIFGAGEISYYASSYTNDGETLQMSGSKAKATYQFDKELSITSEYVLEFVKLEDINDKVLYYYATLSNENEISYHYYFLYNPTSAPDSGELEQEKYNDLVKHFR